MSLRMTSSALALVALTTPAFADVTPEQVWQSWVEYYTSVGYTVTEGSRDKAGSTLTLKDVVIASTSETSKVDSKVSEVVLTEDSDGRVTTVFADEMNVDISGTDPDGTTYDVPVKLTMPGNSIVTSGAPEDMTHEFNYPTLDVALSTFTSGGVEKPLPINFKIANSTGTFRIVAGSPNKYDYTMASEKVTFDGDVTGDNSENVKFSGSLDGFKTEGTMATNGTIANLETELAQALEAGLAMEGKLQAGALAATFEFSGTDENGQPNNGSGKYDGKGLDASFTMSKDGLGYQAAADAIQFEMTSPQIPTPITYGIEQASFDMQLPVSPSDQPQPFKFAYSLAGMTLGDEIWGKLDEKAQLPRDPASLDLDVTGLLKVTKNIFDTPAADETAGDDTAPADSIDGATADGIDPAAPADDAEAGADMGATEDEIAAEPSPYEPVEVTINQFMLNAVGTKITATGKLNAPEGSDMTAPIGQIDGELEGVNGLLDKLVTMGVVPEDQVMGYRMMLAMFAKPVDGNPEKLTTKLEFKEGGAIFANGQQIK